MNPRLLVVAVLLSSPALAAASPAPLRLLHAGDVAPSTMPLLSRDRAAAPASSFQLPSLALQDELPSQFPALDDGGGASVRSDIVPVLAILLSALVGFGTGHLIANDRDGFILFLVVDIVIWAVSVVLGGVLPGYWLGPAGLGGLAILLSHLIQVLDVYPKVSGGARLVERARERSIVLTSASGPDPVLPGTTRTFSFAF